MAKIASVNVDCSVNGGAEAIWNLIDLLVNGGGGWSIIAQSDGSGNPVTGPGAVVNGLNNPNAYVVIQEPAGTHTPGTAARRYFFQRGAGVGTAGSHLWWVRYMRSNAAIAGGTNTVMPFPTPNTTGTIENLVGTPSAVAALFDNSGGNDTRNYLTHAVANTLPFAANAVPGDTGAYFFAMFCTIRVTGAISGGCYALPLTQPSAGPVGSGDEDPVIVNCLSGVNVMAGAASLAGAQPKAYFRFGTVSAAFVEHTTPTEAPAVSGFSQAMPANPYTGADIVVGAMWRRLANPFSYKGYTDLFLLSGTSRTYPNTINLNSDAYVYTVGGINGNLLVPWPNGVTPLV